MRHLCRRCLRKALPLKGLDQVGREPCVCCGAPSTTSFAMPMFCARTQYMCRACSELYWDRVVVLATRFDRFMAKGQCPEDALGTLHTAAVRFVRDKRDG